ncbi:uncharacterized protein LOC125767292 isoform X2 [Anopheles funestus]|uniref:uncharacterized protein LOC125767292 isoform X2 n=1 Tax=Anopheles funestus TaxID=62324 RepID=UPI0020C5B88A|nr:uncharacterized protein LOC125767292 isoform X2 [Anopheles funestus]
MAKETVNCPRWRRCAQSTFNLQDIPGSYAVQCYQHYPAVEQATLYDFVILSDVANKWMKFVTFVTTDHKPIGVGKMYKVAIGTQTFLFVTVEHQQGQYLILQNSHKNDILNLRVEIRFTTVFCVPMQLEANDVVQKQLDSFSTVKANATGEMDSMINNTISNVQNAKQQRRDVFSSRKCGSELSFKLYSLYDSLLFQVIITMPCFGDKFRLDSQSAICFSSQNTIGVMIRYLLSLRLEHSLTNLAHILPHVER